MSVLSDEASDASELAELVKRNDPYLWLEAGDSPPVIKWSADQDRQARRYLDALPRRKMIAARLGQLAGCGKLGATIPRGPYCFFTRRTTGMEHHSLYVETDGVERTLVDPDRLDDKHETLLDWWTPSPDGQYVCFGQSSKGDENSTLHLVETATGRWLEEAIDRCRAAAVAFEPGNGAILYTRYPGPRETANGEEHYRRQVWRHVVGTDSADDRLIFGESLRSTDFISSISISHNGQWTVVVVARGWTQSDLWIRPNGGSFHLIVDPGDHLIRATFVGDMLVALTNVDAPKGRLVAIDPKQPEPPAWRDIIPQSPDTLVTAAYTANRIAVHWLVDACSKLTLHTWDGKLEKEITLPDRCTVTSVGAHWTAPNLYITLESFTLPPCTILADTGDIVRRHVNPSGLTIDSYATRQEWCEATDGTRLPVFMVGRESGTGPVVLTGYGGFNSSQTPVWAPGMLPFLAEGGLVAVACIRGGGEYGEEWHQAGMLGNKQRSFDDFISVAQWLVDSRYTTASQLGLLGGSNGGLLVAVAMTQRPELFGCVVAKAPVLDMLRYEQFKIGPLWTAEYGSPSDPEQFEWLADYSPYHHINDRIRYPPVLLVVGGDDSRVDPMHARKTAARLQAACPNIPMLLRIQERVGHGKATAASDLVAEEVDVWSFLQAHLGASVSGQLVGS